MANLIPITYPKWVPKSIRLLGKEEAKAEPLVNDWGYMDVISSPYGKPTTVNYETLWGYFKGSPELIAMLTAMAEDVVSDGWYLEGGRNKRIAAEKFLKKNKAKEVFMAIVMDMLVTGDGYMYQQIHSLDSATKTVTNALKAKGIEHKSFDLSSKESLKYFDEDMFTPRSFVDLPSSTITAKYDKHANLKGWVQKVSSEAKPVQLSVEEVIHFRYLKLDGKFYGYSPTQSLLTVMDTIKYVQQYAKYYFEKGGMPNRMFILEDESPDSPNHKAFKKALQLFASMGNKHKSLVTTGKISSIELNKMDRDMEFRELALYLTRLMATVWGIPANRLPVIMGKESARGDVGANEGYYRKISHLQDMFEDTINEYLLKAFDVEMKFHRTYKQDEMRETQNMKMLTDVAEQRMRMKLWTREAAAKFLKIEEEDMPTEEEIEKEQEELQNQFNQTQSTKDADKSENKQFDDKLKQNIAVKNKMEGSNNAV